ncbi:Na(+)/H(+) exchange regulatory cofactor NHE-RF3-like [Leptodactylus fuscus]|uniref:Na(+)/H(+) exchange regulatory cofactor NHE-RF3-like n=1 Tax=Leptodactylus fuscus TaxID=238119 RepID=UPI003F4E81E7
MALDAAKTRECSLTKPDGKGYGFFLRIEKDILGHLVRAVESGSVADTAGLKDGDRVIKVNGKFIDDEEHLKVVEMIQASGQSVTLTILDEDSYLKYKRSQEDPTENKTPSGPAESPRPRLCYLVKDKGTYGFSVKTQKGASGFYLDALLPDGVASKAGIKPDDRIVELNGKNVEGCSYENLIKQMKESGDSVMFLVVDKATDDQFYQQKKNITALDATPELLPSPPRIVELEKGEDGYGYYLRQEKNRKGHFIVEIEVNSPAYKAGLKDYDRVVAVNGESVESFDHEQVVEAIRKGGNKSTLLISNKVTDEIYAKAGISPFLYLKSLKAPKPIKTETPKSTEAPAPKPSLAPAPSQPAATTTSAPKHKPRLCRVTKGSSGFGFNLNAIKDVPGQYFKQVIKGGPADVAGIKEEDILVEVNGVNVEKESYEDVIVKIKEAGKNVTLLVASPEVYDHFKAQKIQITSSMADPLPETNSPNTPTSNQQTPPNKADPIPEKNSPPVASSNQTSPSPEPKHKPRLCRVTKGTSGFGFNLNAIKDVPGQYIKQVTKGGPADVAGIKEEDILVEINGVNVEKESYENAVMRIKEAGKNVTLLVASPEVYDHFKAQKIQITSSMADPLPETNSPNTPTSNQQTPPNKADPIPEKNSPNSPSSNQTTQSSKARSAPEPAEGETNTPAEEPPKEDDDTAL